MALKQTGTTEKKQGQTKNGASAAPDFKENVWERIEDFLDESEEELLKLNRKLKETVGEAQVKAHLGLMEIDEKWDELRRTVAKGTTSLKETSTGARGLLDRTKVKMHLAKMDAEDSFEPLQHRLEKLKEEAVSLKSKTSEECGRALDRMAQACKDLAAKLR